MTLAVDMIKKSILLILFYCFVISISQIAKTEQSLYPSDEATGVEIPAASSWTDDIAYACDYICGDANGDQAINVSDAVSIINYVFAGGDQPYPFAAGDANGDGNCNISDAVFIINYVFIGGSAPLACPYLIKIVNLQPGDNTVSGTANITDTTMFRVVLWAKTDRWYVQPSIANPYTTIQSDGTWSNSTYPWDQMVALLVDLSYVPGSIRDYHPSMDPGVICWDEYPGKSVRYI
nr:hypothetical protein [Fodinibius sp.]NIY23914.1 hypothetical protein [Fodinibius sp.]